MLISMAERTENEDAGEDPSYEFFRSSMEIEDKSKSFENFYGAEESVNMLKECIVLPLRFPQLFQGLRSHLSRSFMIYGPPGCGKSHLLYAAANAASVKLFLFNVWNLQSAMIRSKFGPEKCFELVFKLINENAPCILCFEDLEVFSKRDSHFQEGKMVLIHKLHEEFNKSRTQTIFVVGVTQKPWEVDLYLKRLFLRNAGSYVQICNKEERLQHLKALFASSPNNLQDEDFDQIAEKTEGFTGSCMCCLVQAACMRPVRRLTEVTHFKKVIIQNESNSVISDTSNEDCDHQNDDLSDDLKETSTTTEKFVPCKPNDDGAISMSIFDIPEDKLCLDDYQKVDMKCLQEALIETKPCVTEEDLKKYEDFAQ